MRLARRLGTDEFYPAHGEIRTRGRDATDAAVICRSGRGVERYLRLLWANVGGDMTPLEFGVSHKLIDEPIGK